MSERGAPPKARLSDAHASLFRRFAPYACSKTKTHPNGCVFFVAGWLFDGAIGAFEWGILKWKGHPAVELFFSKKWQGFFLQEKMN